MVSIAGAAVSMALVWLLAVVVFLVVEAIVPGLVSIWFALGAVFALIVSFIAPQLWWVQLLVFIAVSIIALLITRPLAKRFLEKNKAHVNADRFIGADGVVIADIDNIQGVGQVKSMGTVWSARTEDDDVKLSVGTAVTIKRIEGVKVIVEKKN